MDKKYHRIMKMKIREIIKGIIINKINKIDKLIYKTTEEGKILTVIFLNKKQHKIRESNIYKIKMLKQLSKVSFQGKELKRLQPMKLLYLDMPLKTGVKNFGKLVHQVVNIYGTVFVQRVKSLRKLLKH